LSIRRSVKVSIRVNRGLLQLVWVYPPKNRNYLGTGLTNTEQHRSIAGWTAREIEQDIFIGQYDNTLRKYRGAEFEPVKPPAKITQATFHELWEQFTEYKSPSLGTTTINGQYRHHRNLVEKCPHKLELGEKIRAWALDNYSIEVARRWMVAINAMGKWAVKMGKIDQNPFEDMAIPKPKNQSKPDIDPFTAEERDRIIAVFKDHPKHCHYWRLVQFLFFTGARPNEAIALRWGNVTDRSIALVESAGVGDRGQKVVTSGLKSQTQRKIPVSPKILESLGDAGRDGGLVFPAKKGGLITWGNFSRQQGKKMGAWYEVLEIAQVAAKNPYQTRHTYITLALDSGAKIQDIAKLVGNSPKVLVSSYLGISRELEQPDI
jgi:integrase